MEHTIPVLRKMQLNSHLMFCAMFILTFQICGKGFHQLKQRIQWKQSVWAQWVSMKGPAILQTCRAFSYRKDKWSRHHAYFFVQQGKTENQDSWILELALFYLCAWPLKNYLKRKKKPSRTPFLRELCLVFLQVNKLCTNQFTWWLITETIAWT